MIPKKKYNKYITHTGPKDRTLRRCKQFPMSGKLSSAGFLVSARQKITIIIKSTLAALAATPLLFSGAAFAGPYVNVEASGSYPDGAYESSTWEFQL